MAVHMGILTEALVTIGSGYDWRFGMGWAAVAFSLIGMIFSCAAISWEWAMGRLPDVPRYNIGSGATAEPREVTT